VSECSQKGALPAESEPRHGLATALDADGYRLDELIEIIKDVG